MGGFMHLGELISAEIERRGINQKEAALEMGVADSPLSKWLRPGAPRPSPESCAKIARFLGMATADVQRLAGYPVSEEQPQEELSAAQSAAVAQVIRWIKESPDEQLPHIVPSVGHLFAAFNSAPPPPPKDNDGGTPQRSRAEITLEEPRLEHAPRTVNSWRAKQAIPAAYERVPVPA
jgi:transcriptional regulator with XRE-family HTH domain